MTRSYLFNLLLLAFFFTLMLQPPAHGQEIGRVTALTGRADVSRAKALPVALKLNDPVYATDTLRTKGESRLVLTMADQSRLTLGEHSRLELSVYQLDSEPAGRLKLIRGRIRAVVSEFFSRRSESFKVRTPTAIAGVMGTDFLVSVHPYHTRVIVFDGVVVVSSSDPAIPGKQLLHKNQSTTVPAGEPPSPPISLDQFIEQLLGLGGTSGATTGTPAEQPLEDVIGEQLTAPPADLLTPGASPPLEPDQPPAEEPTPPGGPQAPSPAPPSDPPPPGQPDEPPGPPSLPPGQANNITPLQENYSTQQTGLPSPPVPPPAPPSEPPPPGQPDEPPGPPASPPGQGKKDDNN